MENSEFELKLKKDFFLYKRSTTFIFIYFLFYVFGCFNLFRYYLEKDLGIPIVASISMIIGSLLTFVTKGIRLRLNKKGTHFVSIVSVGQLIFIILWLLGLSS